MENSVVVSDYAQIDRLLKEEKKYASYILEKETELLRLFVDMLSTC